MFLKLLLFVGFFKAPSMLALPVGGNIGGTLKGIACPSGSPISTLLRKRSMSCNSDKIVHTASSGDDIQNMPLRQRRVKDTEGEITKFHIGTNDELAPGLQREMGQHPEIQTGARRPSMMVPPVQQRAFNRDAKDYHGSGMDFDPLRQSFPPKKPPQDKSGEASSSLPPQAHDQTVKRRRVRYSEKELPHQPLGLCTTHKALNDYCVRMVQVGRLQKDWLIEKTEKAAEKGLDCCFCRKHEKKNKPYYIDNGPDRRGHYDSTGDALMYYQMGRMDGERANQSSDPAPPPVPTNQPSGATPSPIPASGPPESSNDPGCFSGCCEQNKNSELTDSDVCCESAGKVAEECTSTCQSCLQAMPSPDTILSCCGDSRDFLGQIVWAALKLSWEVLTCPFKACYACGKGLAECCEDFDCGVCGDGGYDS